ncbi:hypothetical protein RMN57_07175 [Kitasatospora sp. CM 4170]|uniref:Uncharacterized protein n=1 Tax=Kitasatospora aburaviensis TaxID=67265 RepID=A0ABW1ER77_9ACTN|nr:hypothetical protein [Kitasatospora sp. CM 4170]WNM44505.1 hypothetical protein RMN57_07175 [Kitasatospora sp. CM 4170]
MTPPARIQPSPGLHGYGVRWDHAARLYRVRNEVTGEWLRGPGGELAGFSLLSAATSAWRAFECHSRSV